MFGVSVGYADRDQGTWASIDAPRYKPAVKRGKVENWRVTDDWLSAYLVETKWLKPKVLSCAVEVEEKRTVITVNTESEGLEYRYYLDAKTYLPLRVERQEGSLPWQNYLEDYRRVDGIMLPGRRRWVYGVLAPESFTVSYEINPTYDPDLFKRDPSIEAGPDAWRLKKQ
jgi:hypothetical protein